MSQLAQNHFGSSRSLYAQRASAAKARHYRTRPRPVEGQNLLELVQLELAEARSSGSGARWGIPFRPPVGCFGDHPDICGGEFLALYYRRCVAQRTFCGHACENHVVRTGGIHRSCPTSASARTRRPVEKGPRSVPLDLKLGLIAELASGLGDLQGRTMKRAVTPAALAVRRDLRRSSPQRI